MNSYIKSALIEADQKEKSRVNCSGQEDGIVILAHAYRELEAKFAALQAPVSDAEEREAFAVEGSSFNWKRANEKSVYSALSSFSRLLRQRTEALREAEAKIAALENRP